MKLLELMLDKLEELGWSYYKEDREGEEKYSTGIEMSKFSPAGEDFSFHIWCDGTGKIFLQEIREYSNDFDTEEHALLHVGGNGAPSLRVLLDDADAIEGMIESLEAELDTVEDEFNEILDEYEELTERIESLKEERQGVRDKNAPEHILNPLIEEIEKAEKRIEELELKIK